MEYTSNMLWNAQRLLCSRTRDTWIMEYERHGLWNTRCRGYGIREIVVMEYSGIIGYGIREVQVMEYSWVMEYERHGLWNTGGMGYGIFGGNGLWNTGGCGYGMCRGYGLWNILM